MRPKNKGSKLSIRKVEDLVVKSPKRKLQMSQKSIFTFKVRSSSTKKESMNKGLRSDFTEAKNLRKESKIQA